MTYFLTVQDFDNKFIHKNKPLKRALSEQIRLLCQNVRAGFRGH
jgi:hypothetical protein